MGFRMYNYTTKIEKVEGGFFNHKLPQLEYIFISDCSGMTTMESELGEWMEWEIPINEFKHLIDSLKKEDKNTPMEEIYNIKNFDYTVGEFLEILEKILKDAEKKENFSSPEFVYLRWG